MQGVTGSSPVVSTRKEPTFVYDKCGFFSTIFALRRVVLLGSDIRLKPSDIALWAVKEATVISVSIRS